MAFAFGVYLEGGVDVELSPDNEGELLQTSAVVVFVILVCCACILAGDEDTLATNELRGPG